MQEHAYMCASHGLECSYFLERWIIALSALSKAKSYGVYTCTAIDISVKSLVEPAKTSIIVTVAHT